MELSIHRVDKIIHHLPYNTTDKIKARKTHITILPVNSLLYIMNSRSNSFVNVASFITSNPCLLVTNTVVLYLSYSELKIQSDFKLYTILYGKQYAYSVASRAGTIQSVSIQYRYRGQPIRIDTVIMSYRYTNMVTAAKMKQLFRKESSCFLKTKSLNIYHHLSV